MYYIGVGAFAIIAILCVVAFFKTRGRERAWERDENREGRW